MYIRMWVVGAAALSLLGSIGCSSDDGNGEPDNGGTAGTSPTPPSNGGDNGTVDWSALQLDPAVMYSAYDGQHTFQVPVQVAGVNVPLEGWTADPADAVSFDADPETGGVLLTVLRATESVTISARTGEVGGTAQLFITAATPAEWATGEARYTTGGDLVLPMMGDFMRDDSGTILYMGEPISMMGFNIPNDLSCNNCHTTGAAYFEVQHTPTQVASYSDQELINIFTMGQKPPGAGFKVLPAFFEPIYAASHTWDATEAESKGLVVYLRSLTPTPQGMVAFPTGIPGGGGIPGAGM